MVLREIDLSPAGLGGSSEDGRKTGREIIRREISAETVESAGVRQVVLRGVDLSGLQLAKADLSSADCAGANLSRAALSGGTPPFLPSRRLGIESRAPSLRCCRTMQPRDPAPLSPCPFPEADAPLVPYPMHCLC